MSSDENIGELDDEMIETLFDAGPNVRHYMAKVVSNKPLHHLVGRWEKERPDDFDEMRTDETVEPAVNLSSPGEFVQYYMKDEDELTQVESEYIEELLGYIYMEIRNAQKRLTLTPMEFTTYLLSQAGEQSEETIADELGVSVEAVTENIEGAREKFRTSMRMIDLCERVDDPQLEEELEAWRIFRDPVLSY